MLKSVSKKLFKSKEKVKRCENQPKAEALPWFRDGKELIILSLNMEYYHKYIMAQDKSAYKQYLKEKIKNVDVLCIQEDLLIWSDEFLKENMPLHDFDRIVTSMTDPKVKNSTLKDMIYENSEAMKNMTEHGMKEDSFRSILGNSIYLKKSTEWKLMNQRVTQISRNLVLPSKKPLGYRSVVCATLRHEEIEKPAQVLCTHLSGGRFEDAYLTHELKLERSIQIETCLKQRDDSADNVLVGDFNASPVRTSPLDSYLELLRKSQKELSSSDYYSYMIAPFTSCSKSQNSWNLLYKDLDGPTSTFGHVVDFYMISPHMHVQTPFQKPPKVERIRMIKDYMKWVKPTAEDDFPTDVLKESITDHNGVKVTFFQPTKHINSAMITFVAAEKGEWKKIKELEVKLLTPTKSSSECLLYPVIEYEESENGPILKEKPPLVDLINEELKPFLVDFLKKPEPSTFVTFMTNCAAKEREKLNEYGWAIDQNWYLIKRSKNVLNFTEKMSVAHKSMHGDLLNVRVLRELLKANILKRE